jgi:hypothetical protein
MLQLELTIEREAESCLRKTACDQKIQNFTVLLERWFYTTGMLKQYSANVKRKIVGVKKWIGMKTLKK